MGELRDQREALQVRVQSPDGNLRAILKGGQFQSLGFRPGTYRRYRDPELERQLSRLATLLYTAHAKATGELKDRAGLRSYRDPAKARDETERRYLERVGSFTATGAGPLDLVRLRTTGMLNWRCRIRPGTLTALREDDFVAEVSAAATAVRTDIDRRLIEIKDDCFDLRLDDAQRRLDATRRHLASVR